jgi:predicted RNA binding protein YcfA (HicA-like mRNA interferase family)
MLRKLKRAGFIVVRTSGSHHRLRNEAGRSTTVPVHSGQILKPKTFAAILVQTGITEDEFRQL